MTSMRARVIGGRFVVDQQTDLPEGTEVELALVGDTVDALEMVRLDAGLDEALADLDGGDRGTDAFAFVNALRAR